MLSSCILQRVPVLQGSGHAPGRSSFLAECAEHLLDASCTTLLYGANELVYHFHMYDQRLGPTKVIHAVFAEMNAP